MMQATCGNFSANCALMLIVLSTLASLDLAKEAYLLHYHRQPRFHQAPPSLQQQQLPLHILVWGLSVPLPLNVPRMLVVMP